MWAAAVAVVVGVWWQVVKGWSCAWWQQVVVVVAAGWRVRGGRWRWPWWWKVVVVERWPWWLWRVSGGRWLWRVSGGGMLAMVVVAGAWRQVAVAVVVEGGGGGTLAMVVVVGAWREVVAVGCSGVPARGCLGWHPCAANIVILTSIAYAQAMEQQCACGRARAGA